MKCQRNGKRVLRISVVNQSCYDDMMDLEKRIREGICQNPASCLWGRIPRGVSASARESPGGESQTGKEQSNLQGSRQTSSDSHLHEPLTTVQDAEEERENWSRKQTFGHGIAVGKRACCLRTPHKLHWHMLPESNVKHFGFHSKPSKSMQITLWISLCFGPSPLKTSSE